MHGKNMEKKWEIQAGIFCASFGDYRYPGDIHWKEEIVRVR